MDKGKDGKECKEGEEIINDVKSDSEHELSCKALHEFIDEKFYPTLINKIKSDVKISFE